MDIFSHDFTISDADFHRLVQFIQQNYGIDLSKKRQLISSRLSHSLRELGYKDFRTFLEHLFSTRDPADLELVLNMLAEASTTSISRTEQPKGLEENRKVARRGGRIAGNARRELEQETGRPVVTAENAQTLQQLVTGVVEGAAELIGEIERTPQDEPDSEK